MIYIFILTLEVQENRFPHWNSEQILALSDILNGESLEVVEKTKLLGVLITEELKWDVNTDLLLRKGNSRIEFLRRVASFNSSVKDKEINTYYM